MHHILKTDPAIFRAVRDGVMNFQVRKDDRAFQAGDTVGLIYHDRERNAPFNGMAPEPFNKDDNRDPIIVTITFVLRGGQYGLEPGHVAFALSEIGNPHVLSDHP